ncbi:MAG: tRNA epoxyqueuosine(34) reductase QueG [Planctomycetota bacterium]|nr:MAG: tRNA epoxyqueuosine(34) reductase QueG [Planctomycetota bacterium]
MSLTEDIKQKAIELGFDLVGITDASPLDDKQFKFLNDWLALGYAGRMLYMRKNLDKRTKPAKLLENAQSIICLGLNYTPPMIEKKPPDTNISAGRIANYAQYEDYHLFIKRQLRKLTDFIASVAGTGFKFKICVDSAPVPERALAVRAGLGFIGKNHMLINPTLGPQIFLAEIITNLKLQTDESVTDDCSGCNKCVDACPIGALQPDGHLNANKCISYLTIEYKGEIPPDLAEKIHDRLFGCDECVLACPYQQNVPVCKNKNFKFYPARANLNLSRILDMTEDHFQTEFADSPIKRPGLQPLKRNAKICLQNLFTAK